MDKTAKTRELHLDKIFYRAIIRVIHYNDNTQKRRVEQGMPQRGTVGGSVLAEAV